MYDALPERVLRRYLTSMATKSRHIGTCGFCGQAVRCPQGKLSHHGYKRPGWGYIHGSCPGTHEQPWEISPVTGQMAADYFARQADDLEARLRRLPEATELYPLYGGSFGKPPKPIVKAEVPEWEWNRLYEGTQEKLQRQLKSAVEARDEFRENVRKWAPTEIRTIEELERAKQRRTEEVRQVRFDRYTVNRDKTIERIKKAFEKIRRSEEGLKSARDAAKIAKLLDAAAAGADVIYSTYASKPYDLSQNHPYRPEPNDIIGDWKVDDILKHMGLIGDSGYVEPRAARKMRDEAYRGREPWPSQGLDYWKPFWPGWNGTIEYPAGSTGKKDDRRVW